MSRILTLGVFVSFLIFEVGCSNSSHENDSNVVDYADYAELISTNLSDVKFYLYSRNSTVDYEEIIPWDVSSLQKSGYYQQLPLKILVHGFMSNSTDEGGFVQRLKNAYIAMGTEANILVMDWGPLSTVRDRLPLMPYYYKVTRNVPRVAKYLAEMISFLMTHGGATTERMHIVGFSLGAHVSGIAGSFLQQNMSASIARITGLDPAGPVFQNSNPTDRLDPTDAMFVDVTHSNQGKNGYKGVLGHADFYPNGGGPKQPGCQNVTEPVKFLVGLCAHQFAYKLYEKSILQPGNITACQCESVFNMPCKVFDFNIDKCQYPVVWGEDCSKSTRGEFYMKVALNDSDLTLLDNVRGAETSDRCTTSHGLPV